MFHIHLGEHIRYLTVRILNKNGEVLVSPPGSTRKYRVRMNVPTIKDFGINHTRYSRKIENRVEFFLPENSKDAQQVRSSKNTA